MLQMGVQFDKSKLALIHHIKNLDTEDLAKQVYDHQVGNGWPGLVAECVGIMEEWNMEDIMEQKDNISKMQLKNKLKKRQGTKTSKIYLKK